MLAPTYFTYKEKTIGRLLLPPLARSPSLPEGGFWKKDNREAFGKSTTSINTVEQCSPDIFVKNNILAHLVLFGSIREGAGAVRRLKESASI